MPPESNDIVNDVINSIGEDNLDDTTKDDAPDDLDDDDSSPPDDQPDDDDPDGSGERQEEDEEAAEFKLKTQADKKGNLIDPKTGKIVAPAGSARRFYEKAVKSQHLVERMTTEMQRQQVLMNKAGRALQQMQATIQANEKNMNLPKELGITPEEHAEALQVFSKFKNPGTAIEALKYMLTKAVQRGIDIKPLGANAGATDFSVITQDLERRIQEQLKPITDRIQQSDQRNANEQKLFEEREDFLIQTPGIPQQYQTVLDRMVVMPQFQGLGYKGAWLALQNYLLRQRGSPEARNPQRPMGRGRPGAMNQGQGGPDDSPVDVNTEFGDLVKGVMRDYPLSAE